MKYHSSLRNLRWLVPKQKRAASQLAKENLYSQSLRLTNKTQRSLLSLNEEY